MWKAIALRRISEMMAVGGILRLRDFIFSFDVHETETYVEQWLSGAVSSSDSGWTRAELEVHLREEHSTYSWLLEPMLEQAGFTIQDAMPVATKVYTSYTCVKTR
jgi:hypothetical protein